MILKIISLLSLKINQIKKSIINKNSIYLSFSLAEISIALLILSLSVSFLTTLALNYFTILNSVKERFIALNLAQEGLELAIALRNKQIEDYNNNIPWYGVRGLGSYCLSFDNSGNVLVNDPTDSEKGCSINGVSGYSRLITYQSFLDPNYAVKVISKVRFGKNDIVQLNTVLTKWHLVFFPTFTQTSTAPTASLPSVRAELSCVSSSLTGKIYCFGGYPNGGSDIVVYDPQRNEVSKLLVNLNPPRYQHSCVSSSYNNKIYC